MKHEDLSPEEQAALERLRDNAPDAPDALASLDDAGRARVLGAFSGTGTREATDEPADEATHGPADEAADDEPALGAAPSWQPAGPSALIEPLLAPKVTVAGKQVPIVPAAAAVVVVLVALILLVRGCGGGNQLEQLARAGEAAVDSLDEAADEVGDDRLFSAADRVRDDMRRLTREADADYGDLREVLEAGDAVENLGRSILWFVEAAASAAENSFDEETARAAADAAREGARLLTNGDALDQAESLAKRIIDAHIDEHARRADSDEVEEYRRAANDLIAAARANLTARVDYYLAGAELAVATVGDASSDQRDRAQEALQDAYDAAYDAEADYWQADDDFTYFGEQVEWRQFQSFESSVPMRWRP